MNIETGQLSILRNVRALIVLALAIVFLATTSYAVMSDTSVHGLATKIAFANRYCAANAQGLSKNVTFYVLASVWSTSALPTSLSSVEFSLSVDGTNLGTLQAPDKSWDPGQYATFTLTFTDTSASPLSLPTTSTLVLSIGAHANAGFAGAQVSASDKTVQTFGDTSC